MTGVSVPPTVAEPLEGLAVLLDGQVPTLARVLGVLRRRRMPVRSVAVGQAETAGFVRVTVLLDGDALLAARAAGYLRKIIGVHEATTFRAPAHATRELALIKLRMPADGGALLGVAEVHRCTVVGHTSEALVLAVNGSESSIRSCLMALRAFDVMDVVRSGALALDLTASFSPTPLPTTDRRLP